MAISLDELPLAEELPAIPDGWRYESLGDLVEERGVCYGIVQPGSETSDGVPIVRVNNIRNGRIDTADVMRVEAAIESKFLRSRLRGGEVLLTLVGTLGEVAIVPDDLRGWNVARAVGVIPVRKDPGSLWVSICLRSAFIQHCIRTWATTTVQATFNLRDLAKLPIPIPPKETREAIAAVLGALDDKIELNRRMNATLEAMARALFQSWFIDFDPVRQNMDRYQPSPAASRHPLPVGEGRGEGASGLDFDPVRAKLDGRPPAALDPATAALFPDSFQDSGLGHIPKGWRVTTIGETCQAIFSGGTPSTQEARYWGGDIPWLSSGETRSTFIIDTEKSITKSGVENSSTRVARSGCTVIAGAGQGHTRGQTSLLTFESYINQSVVALAANLKVSSDLFLFFDLARRYDEFRQLSDSHSSRGSLTTKLLAGVKCVLPPHELVVAFDKAAQPVTAQITANLQQSRTLATLRDTLLPKLLSGELSVANMEKRGGLR